jgi:hypothetical protein
MWQGTEEITLPDPGAGGDALAQAIDDDSPVGGSTSFGDGLFHAVIWTCQ